jgi:hypothetical protein
MIIPKKASTRKPFVSGTRRSADQLELVEKVAAACPVRRSIETEFGIQRRSALAMAVRTASRVISTPYTA